MLKRVAALAMMLAGSMAVLTPAVAQARDRDDYRRVDRREYTDHRDQRDWREHERWDRRDYRSCR